MAFWGEAWGEDFYWGLSTPGEDWACELAQARLLHWHPQAGNLRKWVCAFAEEIGANLDTLLAVLGAFNLEFAIGEQLDAIGSIVGLPRSGAVDSRYRTFIGIQIKLILSARRDGGNWTGTVNNLLAICREFVGPTATAITITNLPPKAFVLSIPDITDTMELSVLISFLTKATYAEVLGYVVIALGENAVWSDDDVVVPDGGIWNDDDVGVPGGSVWGYDVTIGD